MLPQELAEGAVGDHEHVQLRRRGDRRRPGRIGDERDLAEEVAGAERVQQARLAAHLGAPFEDHEELAAAPRPRPSASCRPGRRSRRRAARSRPRSDFEHRENSGTLAFRATFASCVTGRSLDGRGETICGRSASGGHLVDVGVLVPRREARDPERGSTARASAPSSVKVVCASTVCEPETVSNGPVEEPPALTSAVKPGVSETTVSESSCTGRPGVEDDPDAVLEVPEVDGAVVLGRATRSPGCRRSRRATGSSCSWPSPCGSYAFEATSVHGPAPAPPPAAAVRAAQRRGRRQRLLRPPRSRRATSGDQRAAGGRRRGCRGRRAAQRERMITVRSESGWPSDLARQAWSSAPNASIDAKRSAGSFAIARRERGVERGGTSGRRSRTLGDRLVDVLHRDRDEVVAGERQRRR